MIAKDNNMNLQILGNKIDRPFHSLGQSLRNGSLKIKDLKKIFETVEQPFQIIYKEKTYTITNKQNENEKSIQSTGKLSTRSTSNS